MKNFILGSIVALLFSTCVYLYIQNTSLSATIITYKTDKEFVDKDFQKSKEAYFIQQQSDNVSLILFTVTILFTIFGTVTFIGVKSEFKSAIKKNDKRYDSYKAQYDESVIHINNLRSSLSFQYADKINDNFGKVLLERPLDIPKLIELGLMSCQNYCYTIGYSSNISLILFTVAALFTTFGTVTFISIKSEFHSQIKENNKRYNSYRADYEESVIHINNLRSNFNFKGCKKQGYKKESD
jgi:hypothetical protein